MARTMRKRRHYYSRRQITIAEEYLNEQIIPQLEASGIKRPKIEGGLVVGSAALGWADHWSDFNGWYIFGPGPESHKAAEFVTGLRKFEFKSEPIPGRRWRTPTFTRISWLDRREARSPWAQFRGLTFEEIGLSDERSPFDLQLKVDPVNLWWLRNCRIVYDPSGFFADLKERLSSPTKEWNEYWLRYYLGIANGRLAQMKASVDAGKISLAWSLSGLLVLNSLQALAVCKNILVPPAQYVYIFAAARKRKNGIPSIPRLLEAANIQDLMKKCADLIHKVAKQGECEDYAAERMEFSVEAIPADIKERLVFAYERYISAYFPFAVKSALRERYETASLLARASVQGVLLFADALKEAEPSQAAAIIRRIDQVTSIAGAPQEVVWAHIDLAQSAINACCDIMVAMGLRNSWDAERLW